MSISRYRSGIRSAAYGFWRGVGDREWFKDAMSTVIDYDLPFAFQEGAAQCGIAPEEMTFAEKMAVRRATMGQKMHIDGFADFIALNSKAAGGKRGTVYKRVEVWVNRYSEVVNEAKMMTCADKKLMWTLNALRVAKEHCKSCLRVAWKVKRASQWERSGWRPQGRMLACGGWLCACDLVPTDAPMSRGPLPRVT